MLNKEERQKILDDVMASPAPDSYAVKCYFKAAATAIDNTGKLVADVRYLETKWQGAIEHIKQLEEELKEVKAKLALVKTHREDVWVWQGDGADDPKSLSCPVVMSAHTLRAMLEIAEKRTQERKVVNVPCACCGKNKPTLFDEKMWTNSGACNTCKRLWGPVWFAQMVFDELPALFNRLKLKDAGVMSLNMLKVQFVAVLKGGEKSFERSEGVSAFDAVTEFLLNMCYECDKLLLVSAGEPSTFQRVQDVKNHLMNAVWLRRQESRK